MCLCGCLQRRPALLPGSCRQGRQRSPSARPGCGRRRSAPDRCGSATVKLLLPAPRDGLRVGEHRQCQLTRLPSPESCRWHCRRWSGLMPLQSGGSGGSALDNRSPARTRCIARLLAPLLLMTAETAMMMSARCPSASGLVASNPASRCQVTGYIVMEPRDESVS